MRIELSFRRLQAVLVVIWVCLVVAGFSVEAWKYILYQDRNEWVYLLGLSYEQNLPTWYSSSLLLLCSVLLWLIATAKKRDTGTFKWHWRLLAVMFAYISLDETATLHEDLSDYFDFSGVLYFGWVIPASITVLLLGIFYLPFLLKLPRQTARRFVIAGAFYVGGALGVEFALGYWTDLHGSKNLGYGLIDLVEESMEILGVTLFLLALIDYLRTPQRTIEIDVGDSAQTDKESKKEPIDR